MRARRWSETYLKLDPNSVFAQGLRLSLALRMGSPSDRNRAAAALDTLSGTVLERILWFAPPGRSSLPYTDLVLHAATAPRFPEAERAQALRRLASEHLRNGQIRASLAFEDQARILDGRGHDLFALTAVRIAGMLLDSAVAREYGQMVDAAAYPEEAPFLAAFWAAAGQPDRASVAVAWIDRAADSLAAAGDTADAREQMGSALAYRGHIAAARGDTASAIDLLQRGIAMIRPDWGGPRGLHRFVLARLLTSHGEEGEAVTILRALRRPAALEARAYLEAAGLYERRGEIEAAARYYSWTLDLWTQADPELLPWIESAREGLVRTEASGVPAELPSR